MRRTVEKFRPTLLADELDTFIGRNDELRGILKSGHRRSLACVLRAVGDDFEPRVFSTWSPKMVALIGKLPDTLADRSIPIQMRRKRKGESVMPVPPCLGAGIVLRCSLEAALHNCTERRGRDQERGGARRWISAVICFESRVGVPGLGVGFPPPPLVSRAAR